MCVSETRERNVVSPALRHNGEKELLFSTSAWKCFLRLRACVLPCCDSHRVLTCAVSSRPIQLSAVLLYSAANHTRDKCGSLWHFRVLWTYLQFFGDALALCHELRDYFCLLPQVLQLLGKNNSEIKNEQIIKLILSIRFTQDHSSFNNRSQTFQMGLSQW